jgi:hypothetical protein
MSGGLREALARLAASALVAATLAAPARLARAGTEEFSTFDVATQEEDDESLLDRVLTRSPHAWRDEWEHAPLALRTSQGCLTSGLWFIDTDLKLRAALGHGARLGVHLRQSESDEVFYDYMDFTFQFPTRFGTPGLLVRPMYDKSQQDFALMWDAGRDTAGLFVHAVFTVEDMFNNLWAFRQTRVGQASESYQRHPYEPALLVGGRGDTWRFEVYGQWLTPSSKRLLGYFAYLPPRDATLWGALGHASLEARALGVNWELRAGNHQARSTDHQIDLTTGDNANFRRKWTGEIAARRALWPRVTAEARGLYQGRSERWSAPAGIGTFEAIDRLLMFETAWNATRSLIVRTGIMHDRIGIERSGAQPYFTWDTRKESRAYIGLIARFGRVSLQGIEGIELDHEPYDVWFVHDKGFLHMQTTF